VRAYDAAWAGCIGAIPEEMPIRNG